MNIRHKNHVQILKTAEASAAKYESWYKELEEPFLQ